MRMNRLGPRSVHVSELSFGAAGIGNLYTPVQDETAPAAVDAAWEAGIRSFDTPDARRGTAARARAGSRHPDPAAGGAVSGCGSTC
jgi:D-threo-aldose 1-dehydrogenase